MFNVEIMNEYNNAQGKINREPITTFQEIQIEIKVPIKTESIKPQQQFCSVEVKERLDELRNSLRKEIVNMNDEKLQSFLENYFEWKLLERIDIQKVVPELFTRPLKFKICRNRKTME